MTAPPPRSPRRGRGRVPAPAVVAALLVAVATGPLAACSSGSSVPGDSALPASSAPAPSAAAPDPAVAGYCAAVLRAQQEQTAPQGTGNDVTAAADTARRQVDDLAATAPPEIRTEWAQLRDLTDQALTALTASGGDPNRVDRDALTRLQTQSQPAVERIEQVTSQRCGITFRPPA